VRPPTIGPFAGQSCFRPGCGGKHWTTLCDSRNYGRIPGCLEEFMAGASYVCPECGSSDDTSTKDYVFQRPCCVCRERDDYPLKLRYYD